MAFFYYTIGGLFCHCPFFMDRYNTAFRGKKCSIKRQIKRTTNEKEKLKPLKHCVFQQFQGVFRWWRQGARTHIAHTADFCRCAYRKILKYPRIPSIFRSTHHTKILRRGCFAVQSAVSARRYDSRRAKAQQNERAKAEAAASPGVPSRKKKKPRGGGF